MSTIINDGQKISNVTVDNYQEVISSGGIGEFQTVQNDGEIVIRNGGILIETDGKSNWITQTEGKIVVESGGLLSGGHVQSGGTYFVSAGGITTSVSIGDGGIYQGASGAILNGVSKIRSGGTLSGGTVTDYATLVVSAGGSSIDTTIASAGGLGVAGIAKNTIVQSGGVIEVTSGGLADASNIQGGGKLDVDSNGSINNVVVSSGGIISAASDAKISGVNIIQSGSILSGGNVTAYAAVSISSGGTSFNTIIGSNGGIGLAGTASGTLINSGGVLEITSGGIANNSNVSNGGVIHADSNSTIGSTTVSSGGLVSAASTAIISGIITILDGGSASIWNNAGGTIDLIGNTNNGLTISGLESGGTVSTVISGWSGSQPGNSDSIDLPGVSADGASYAYPSDDQVVVTLENGNTITLNIPGVKNTGFVLSDDGHGGASAEVCFLSGSQIQTPSGKTLVEDLAIGDEIVAYVDDTEVIRRVIWVGQAHCTVRPYLPLDQAGYPVRILKDAVSNGVPFKDMLITAEHCLFFDGKFVPVRMLVNGRSIFYDTSITSYDYYHIETEEHSVIMADGMLTESYLDTGNRSAFRQTGEVVSLTPSRNLSWDDAAAPLTVSRETVEPLFRNIENRADNACFAIQAEARPLTNESDLHLTTDTGAIIWPARKNNGWVMFMIPDGVESVRIVSNDSRPCDVIGPFVDDRRNLGVLVGEITLFESNRTRTLTDHLHDTQLSGWNNVEDGTMRWTSGNALLPLRERSPGSLALMAIEVRAAGPYVLNETILEHQALKA
ncbi:Hint domain-containing protein [Acetobacter pasteurianus]|uniref:Hint domain-containing protein n=1 Tax=Acetobacter pasteurianus TaxID=438 RepID=UPI0003842AB9|nr:Hint domain-containing protein [Acetobacter pasteurianus]CCT61063.1 Adhesin/invasin TibA autotransporter [Acetobacter pasteurianus 386B]